MNELNPKTVAILTTWLDGWYQSRLYKGVIASARDSGSRLVVVIGSTYNNNLSVGSNSIFGIITQIPIDGILISSGPITNWGGVGAISNLLQWMPKVPTISIGVSIPEVESVISDGNGIYSIVSHLIHIHKCEHIAYLTGPYTNPDSIYRLNEYKQALAENNIPYADQLVECGGFYEQGGMNAMNALLAKEIKIDAVVCANDSMAIGASTVLKNRKIHIPDDIKVTGYDDSHEAKYHQPPISSASNPIYELGVVGFNKCLSYINSGIAPVSISTHIIPTTVSYRMSCGCRETPIVYTKTNTGVFGVAWKVLNLLSEYKGIGSGEFIVWLRQELIIANERQIDELFNLMTYLYTEFVHTTPHRNSKYIYEQICNAMKLLSDTRESLSYHNTSKQFSIMRDMYMTNSAILSESNPIKLLSYLAETTKNWCPSGCRLFFYNSDMAPISITDAPVPSFNTGIEIHNGILTYISPTSILPTIIIPSEIWIVMPIEHDGMTYGILMMRNWIDRPEFIEYFRIIVSTALSLSWKTRTELKLRNDLKHLSIHDTLTGLYNRRGLVDAVNHMRIRAIEHNTLIAVLYLDINGLKSINDKYGHIDGDMAIVTMASTLNELCTANDALARLGGDEFAFVLSIEKSTDHLIYIKNINTRLQTNAIKLNKEWQLSAGIGWTIWDPTEGSSIEKQLEKADVVLYQDKTRRRLSELR